jgi:hypothetical protein
MPKKEIDYSASVFYRIVCRDLAITDCYIGHTTNFIKRKHQHKLNCKNESRRDSSYRIYQFIRANGGWDNWDMVMIEQRACENFLEASKVERSFIEEYKATLNSYIPALTKEEYDEYQKKYRGEWYKDNTAHIKDYYQRNKERYKQHQKEQYAKNIDKIKLSRKETIYCDCCKKSITKMNRLKHYNAKIHIENSKNNIDI